MPSSKLGENGIFKDMKEKERGGCLEVAGELDSEMVVYDRRDKWSGKIKRAT
jgi:hypothetical protein